MRITLGSLVLLGSLSVGLMGEAITVNEPRPLMALCGTLQEKYGVLTTFEDAPADPIIETGSEVRPSGASFRFPKWTPITFQVPSELPSRNDSTRDLGEGAPPAESLNAVQKLVDQYNQSANPGRFSVRADAQYIHVQQTMRAVDGRLQAFVPISNRVLTWKSESKSCQEVLVDLFTALRQQHGISVVVGSAPMGSLLTHTCKTTGTSIQTGQVLASVLDGLDTNKVTGKPTLSYTWHLIHDPNWNNYFLNIYLVLKKTSPGDQVKNPKVTAGSQSGHNQGRLGTASPPQK